MSQQRSNQHQHSRKQQPVDTLVRQGRRSAKHKKKTPKWLYPAIAAVCLILLIYGGVQLALKQQDNNRTEEINKQNRELLGTDAPGDSGTAVSASRTPAPRSPAATKAGPASTALRTKAPATLPPRTQYKYHSLIEKNDHMVGWLKTDAIYRIDFAVVQSDNQFYMTHDFSRAENREGCAFLDETNCIWPRDDNLIIYAHNMKTGSMFGELKMLSSYDVIDPNPFTTFNSIYENGDYIPIAVINCDVTNPKAANYFNFYIRNFKTEADFEQFIKRARELSILDLSQVDVTVDDPLLTLSTCFDEANLTRFIVLFRKLRADETREDVKQKYFTVPDAPAIQGN